MNRLSTEKRAEIVGALVEGNSLRATVRMTGAAMNTVGVVMAAFGLALVLLGISEGLKRGTD